VQIPAQQSTAVGHAAEEGPLEQLFELLRVAEPAVEPLEENCQREPEQDT